MALVLDIDRIKTSRAIETTGTLIDNKPHKYSVFEPRSVTVTVPTEPLHRNHNTTRRQI